MATDKTRTLLLLGASEGMPTLPVGVRSPLEREGWRILRADGADAAPLVQDLEEEDAAPDLILVRLPASRGAEEEENMSQWMRSLGSMKERSKVTVILWLEASCSPECLLQAKRAGADDVLIDGFTAVELLGRWLSCRGAGRTGGIASVPPRRPDEEPTRCERLAELCAYAPCVYFHSPGDQTAPMVVLEGDLPALIGSPESPGQTETCLWELIHQDDRQHVLDVMRAACLTGAPYDLEYRLCLPDRSEPVIRERGQWGREDGGTARARRGIMMNVSDGHELETERRQAVDHLVERVKELRTIERVVEVLESGPQKFEDVFGALVKVLPDGWKNPSQTGARISFGDHVFCSPGFVASEHTLCERFSDAAHRPVVFEISVDPDQRHPPQDPFVQEEKRLLRLIASVVRAWMRWRQAEVALRDSAASYRVLAESSLDAISLHDADGRYTYASPAARTMFGYEPEELIGRNPYDYIHAADRNIVRTSHEAILREGETYPVTYRIRHASGHYVWIETTVRTTAPARAGDDVMIVAVSRDVTIRKLTEDALRGSELMLREQREVLQQIIANIPHAVSWKDVHGRYLGGNDRFAALAGVESIDVIVDRVEGQLSWPGDQAEVFRQRDELLLRTGEPQLDREEVLRTADGQVLTMLSSRVPWRNSQGDIVGVLCIHADITERKRSELELRASEAKLHAITSQLPAAVWTTDPSLRLTSLNGAMISRFVPSRICLIDQPVTELIESCSGEGQSAVIEAHRRALRGQSVSFSQTWDDSEVDIMVEPLHGQRDEIMGCLALVLDVTERAQTRKLEEERSHLQDAVGAMEQVLGVIGHELRTPLTGLRAMSEFLLSEIESPEHGNFLRSINDEVVRMSGMVNNLLEAARINSGLAHWNWTIGSVRELVEGALGLIQPTIDSSRVRLLHSVDVSCDEIACDEDAIHRLLVNLLSNSAKYTSGGCIELAVRELHEEGWRWIEFVVRDDGEGIPPETVRKLGVAFALNSGVVGSSHVRGSGLGLSICRGIAHAHGGRISVDSTVGEGTTFTVRIRADLAGPAESSAGICPIEQEGQHG